MLRELLAKFKENIIKIILWKFHDPSMRTNGSPTRVTTQTQCQSTDYAKAALIALGSISLDLDAINYAISKFPKTIYKH